MTYLVGVIGSPIFLSIFQDTRPDRGGRTCKFQPQRRVIVVVVSLRQERDLRISHSSRISQRMQKKQVTQKAHSKGAQDCDASSRVTCLFNPSAAPSESEQKGNLLQELGRIASLPLYCIRHFLSFDWSLSRIDNAR
jgi:hypothetical protein